MVNESGRPAAIDEFLKSLAVDASAREADAFALVLNWSKRLELELVAALSELLLHAPRKTSERREPVTRTLELFIENLISP
jgi:hypothetical protein